MNVSGPLLSVDHAVAGYGKKDVLKGISLSLGHKEITGLLGLNGAGKTTIIKTIVQLKTLNDGSISSQGDSQDLYQSKRLFSYLPERFDPPSFLTAYEFLKFTLKLYGYDIARDEAHRLAEQLGLDPDVLNSRVQSFSKGMRQKLGIMASVLPKCPLLILDEPMSGLDPRARQQVKTMVKAYKAEGRTVFFSSHILTDAVEICDKIIVLHGGKLIFEGATDIFLEQDKDRNPEKAFLSLIETPSQDQGANA